MMKNSLYIMLATMLLSFASCTSDEMEVVDTPTGKGEYTVRFSIDNPSEVQSRAYENLEGKINQLYAVVFEGTGVTDPASELTGNEALKGVYFVEVEESTTEAGTYDCSFRMDQSGEFVTCFVANANTELVNAMKGAANLSAFKSLVATQAPETFLMTSKEFLDFTLDEDHTTSDLTAEAVTMQRIMARIDVLNGADDLTITEIVFKNRAIQSVLWRDDAVSSTTQATDVEANKTYTATVAGNSTTPGEYKAEIYTYEWIGAADGALAPSLEFSYELNGNSNTFNKTLEFVRTDDDDDRIHVPLKRNNLYTVTVQMSNNKINFVIEVLDWETGDTETFNVTHDALADKGTAIRPDQHTLNEALKVYGLFTEYNVASVTADGTVTFETTLHNNAGAPATNTDASVNGYFTYEAAMALTDLKDAAGNSYRLPTAGELNLLLPTYSITNTVTNHPWWNDDPDTNTAGNHINTEEYKETIYLEDAAADTDGYVYWDTTKPLTGWSRMKLGTDDQVTNVPHGNGYNVRPIYAYRFKGTDQYAAYRWESCKMEGAADEKDRYFSVKIKALSNYHDADITVEDIAEESFWADGYIEYKFPASGYYHYQTGALTYRGINGYCWSSSRYAATNARHLGFHLNGASVGGSGVGSKFPLRLVKVSQE